MKIKQKIKNFSLDMIDFLSLYYKSLNSNKIMNVRYIENGYFELFNKQKIYVAKIENTNNYFEALELTKLRKDKKDELNAQIFFFVYKKEKYESVWFSTFNKSLLELVVANNSTIVENADKEDVCRFLLDVYDINNYDFDDLEYNLKQQISYRVKSKLNNLDPFFINFRELIKEHAYNSVVNTKVFQVIKYTSISNINHKSVFKDFNGLFCQKINLSHDSNIDFVDRTILSSANNKDIEIKEETREYLELVKNNFINQCLVNSIIITKDENSAFKVASAFGFEITELFFSKLDILRKTIMLSSNNSYNTPMLTEKLENIVGSWNKKIFSLKEIREEKEDAEVDIFGIDIFFNMINHSFKACKSPHVFLCADTGVGKSVALQRIISLILRYDVETNEAKRFFKTKIRYMEKGISNHKFMTKLKLAYGDEVGYIIGKEDEEWFSLFDYKIEDNGKPSKEDINFTISIINVLLESSNEQILNGLEDNELRKAINSVFMDKERKVEDLTISKILSLNSIAYGKAMNKLIENYGEYTKIKNIDGYENYKVPTLHDIIREISSYSHNTTLNDNKKDRLNNLVDKLNIINNLEIFSYYNSNPLSDKQIWSVDFQHIAKNKKIFAGYFLNIFLRFYRRDSDNAYKCDIEGKPSPRIIYNIEEFDSFNKYDSFKLIFKEVKQEARKWNITFFPISQYINHFKTETTKDLEAKLPIKINGYGTMMFLIPPKKNGYKEILQSISDVGINVDETTEYVFANLRPHMLGVISDLGTFGIDLQLSKKELELFSSNEKANRE